jgi:glutamate/tyrosine decarboxylase-like PLP-dependent enzyme
VTTTPSHPGLTGHATPVQRGFADRIRAIGERLSDRAHAAADERARARGWQVTETPGPLGLRGRSYHDPRFTTRRRHSRAARTGRDQRHD